MSAETAIRSSIPARLDALPWFGVALAGWCSPRGELAARRAGVDRGRLDRAEPAAARHARARRRRDRLGGLGLYRRAVLGALVFGRLADRLGRKRIFLVTLAVYSSPRC